MKVVIQRVKSASVVVNGQMISEIAGGLLILLGISESDTKDDVDWLVRKIVLMRIFSDAAGKMNKDVTEVNGEILLVSQFTLYASTRKGNRPSFIRSAKPELAIPLYESFKDELEILLGKKILTGEFGAMMDVQLINDGPVTILMDSAVKE